MAFSLDFLLLPWVLRGSFPFSDLFASVPPAFLPFQRNFFSRGFFLSEPSRPLLLILSLHFLLRPCFLPLFVTARCKHLFGLRRDVFLFRYYPWHLYSLTHFSPEIRPCLLHSFLPHSRLSQTSLTPKVHFSMPYLFFTACPSLYNDSSQLFYSFLTFFYFSCFRLLFSPQLLSFSEGAASPPCLGVVRGSMSQADG